MTTEDRVGNLEFLVVGTARSGTTLVQRLCCELPSVWVPAETHFWSTAEANRYRFDYPLRRGDRAAMAEMVLQQLLTRSLPVRASEVLDEIVRRDRRVGLWTVFESMVAAMSPPGRLVLGEKTPNHLSWWEHFMPVKTGWKLLAVVRDPRAVLRSQRRVAWGESDAYALAERWLHHQRAILDARRMLGADRVLIIRYEDLVGDEAGHQKQIADFLGVAAAPDPLGDELLSEYPLFPAREEWKENAMRPASTEHISEWEDELSEDDVAAVDTACRELMGEFGYVAGDGYAVPAGEEAAIERVRAFRQWHASVAGLTGLPIY